MPTASATPYFRIPSRVDLHRPLFIFLPGMDGTGSLLHLQMEGLGTRFDIRCLAIPPTELADWATLTDQVLTLIHQALKGRSNRCIYLCGESFGGCLAMYVAVRSPELFHRIILINPASSLNRRPWLHWGSYATRWVPEPLYHWSCLSLLPFLAALNRMEEGDRVALLRAMQSVPQTTAFWRLALLRDFHLTDQDLQRILRPVLLIASASDTLLPSVEEVDFLAQRLPKSQIHILPDSGHTCLLEKDTHLDAILQANQFF